MKKNLIFLMLTSLLVFASCDRVSSITSDVKSKITSKLTKIKSRVFGHGLKTETFDLSGETSHAGITIKVELPKPHQGDAADQIRSKLIDIMDEELGTQYSGDKKQRIFPAFVGDKDDSKALIAYYREKKKAAIARESQESFDHYGEEDWSTDYTWNLEKVYETDKIVVFKSHGYISASDMMHAAAIGQGPFTFDKKDGHLVTTILKKYCESDIDAVLKKGLAQYFSVDPENLAGEIDMDEFGGIPLPAETPQPTEDGLLFQYQQYEISYGAAGAPYFTVPYEEVFPFCTQEAVRLFIGDYQDITEKLSNRVAECCTFIPDNFGFHPDWEDYMTNSLSRAWNEAFDAPNGENDEFGEDLVASGWLWMNIGTRSGNPVFTVKSVLQTDPTHAIAWVDNNLDWGGDHPEFYKEHFITLAKEDGKWLIDDFDGKKFRCYEYLKELRTDYKSGKYIEFILASDYFREYIEGHMDAIKNFYRKYGYDGEPSSSSSSPKNYTYSGFLFNDTNSYGIEMRFSEEYSLIKGRYRYLSMSAEKFLPIYGSRSSDGKLHIYTGKGNELFILQPTDGGTSLTGEWYMYNDGGELHDDPARYRSKKHLQVTLQQKR